MLRSLYFSTNIDVYRLPCFHIPFVNSMYVYVLYRTCVEYKSVTTVPLSVCYGALNLLVRVDASNFVPYACDWAVTGGEYEGPEVPHRRPLFPVIAWQRNGRTVLRGLSHLYFPSLCLPKCWDPMLALCPFFL